MLFIGDLKLFAKSHDQIDSLLNTIYTFSEDIGMEFGIKKSGGLIGILKFRESVSVKDFKKLLDVKRVKNWKEKQIYGQFIRNALEGTDKEKS